MHDGHPIVYALKTLSSTERKYAQIEKETLAILFAYRKFELYIIGKPVTVETDHQPLVRIFKKPLVEAPLRIQRMMLTLQRYQTLCFTPGKEVVIADMLSRVALQTMTQRIGKSMTFMECNKSTSLTSSLSQTTELNN